MIGGWRTLALGVALGLALQPRVAAHQDPPPRPALSLRIDAERSEVEFGERFGLRIVCAYDEGLAVEPWGEDLLAPLDLGDGRLERHAADGRVIETRVFEARLFTAGEVVIPAAFVRARPRAGGDFVIAFADELVFDVASSLAADDDGAIELPFTLLPAPWSWRRALPLALGLFALVGLGSWYLRRRALRPAVAVPPRPPAERALDALAALAARRIGSAADAQALHAALSGVLRGYLAGRAPDRPLAATTEEVAAAEARAPSFGPAQTAQLVELLARCDRVKFAKQRVDVRECTALLDAAADFVRDTGRSVESAGEDTHA